MDDILKNVKGPARVRSILAAGGVSQMDVVRESKYSLTYVRAVIDGKRVGHRVRKVIARMCGTTVNYIWQPEEGEEDPKLPKAA